MGRLITRLLSNFRRLAWRVYRCPCNSLVRWTSRRAGRKAVGWSRLHGSKSPGAILPLDRQRLQKWRSLLAVGALMIAGCLLLLHLHVVDSLTTYSSLQSVQGDLPAFMRSHNGFDDVRKSVTTKEEGIPEAEMVDPVKNDLLLDTALQAPEELNGAALQPNASWCRYQDLKRALGETAQKREIFIQVIPNPEHVVLAANNLATLKRRTGKTNLLFVCRDVMQCVATQQHNVSCYIDETKPNSSAPVFSILLMVLQLKYNVIYMDFETSITNTLPLHFESEMVIPYGTTSKAHSFYVATYSTNVIRFHKMAMQDAELHMNKSFAAVFKWVLDKSLRMKPAMQMAPLDGCTKHPGKVVCPVLRHPQFSSAADRKLWVKEKQMWFLDNTGYYSSAKTLYLSYENNYNMGHRTVEYEIHALKNALAFGKILDRQVILPKFFCEKCEKQECKPVNCLLSAIINMTQFDSVFGESYREHSFRGHPLVPINIKKNISENIQIASPLRRGMQAIGGVEILPKVTPNKVILADNFYEGPDSDEVLELFSGYTNKKILRFVNLYGAFSGFNSARESLQFERMLKEGLVKFPTKAR